MVRNYRRRRSGKKKSVRRYRRSSRKFKRSYKPKFRLKGMKRVKKYRMPYRGKPLPMSRMPATLRPEKIFLEFTPPATYDMSNLGPFDYLFDPAIKPATNYLYIDDRIYANTFNNEEANVVDCFTLHKMYT